MIQRSPSRQLQTVNIARSSRALLACAVTAGLTFQVATHPAKAEEAVTAEGYLADLVNQLTEAKGAVSSMELEMGGLREGANKARVDLAKAQKAAQKAQNQVLDARGRLSLSDDAVTKAQGELDQIARSAYNAGGDGSPIHLAAGGDAAGDTLDRSTFIRMATERQESMVNRLDLARTQTANEESELRANRSTANGAVSKAVEAHKEANKALSKAMQQLKQKMTELEKLIEQQKIAQRKLDAARKAINNVAKAKPEASSWDKRRAAEAAANKAEDSATAEVKDEETTSIESTPSETTSTEATATETNTPETTSESAASTTESAESATENTETTTEMATAEANVVPAPDASNPLGEVPEVQTNFESNAAGDRERQLAINGLINSGSDAIMAGFTSYNEHGDQERAINDAVAAGRDSAGRHYDNAQSELHPSQATSTTATDTESAAATETEAASETRTTAPTIAAPAETTTEDSSATVDESTSALEDVVTATDSTEDSSLLDDGTTTTGDSAVTGDTPILDALDNLSTDTAEGTASEKIEAVIERAMTQQGVPYAWGGGNYHGPTLGIRDYGVADAHGDYAKVGFDCSGLMMYAFYAVGIELDHYSGSQYNAGRQVPVSEMKRGDMLFWGAGGGQHVALYLGDGKMLEAPQSGSYVKISDVRWGGMTPNAVRLIE